MWKIKKIDSQNSFLYCEYCLRIVLRIKICISIRAISHQIICYNSDVIFQKMKWPDFRQIINVLFNLSCIFFVKNKN